MPFRRALGVKVKHKQPCLRFELASSYLFPTSRTVRPCNISLLKPFFLKSHHPRLLCWLIVENQNHHSFSVRTFVILFSHSLVFETIEEGRNGQRIPRTARTWYPVLISSFFYELSLHVYLFVSSHPSY